MGPDPENRVGDQDNGRPGRPVSSGYKSLPRELCPVRRQVAGPSGRAV